MPGEYLKGFPDPPNSPNEKFLLPSTPHLWQDDLYRDLINNGVPHELALGVSRSIAQHEDRKALNEQHAQKQLEWWANIHTHPGGTEGPGSGTLIVKPEAYITSAPIRMVASQNGGSSYTIEYENTSAYGETTLESTTGACIVPGENKVVLLDRTRGIACISFDGNGSFNTSFDWWDDPAGFDGRGLVVTEDNKVVVGVNGWVECRDLISGSILWTNSSVSGNSSPNFYRMCVVNGRVFVPDKSELHVLDMSDGSLVNSIALDHPSYMCFSDNAGGVIVCTITSFFTPSGAVVRYNANTLSESWETTGFAISKGAMIEPGRAILGSMYIDDSGTEDEISIYYLDTSTGDITLAFTHTSDSERHRIFEYDPYDKRVLVGDSWDGTKTTIRSFDITDPDPASTQSSTFNHYSNYGLAIFPGPMGDFPSAWGY